VRRSAPWWLGSWWVNLTSLLTYRTATAAAAGNHGKIFVKFSVKNLHVWVRDKTTFITVLTLYLNDRDSGGN
jgi:hypothetical protein